MARRLFIAGNWKLNKGPGEADELARALRTELVDITGVELAVGPTFLAIPEVVSRLQHTDIAVAAQNLHWERAGAFTGEISGPMLKTAGCTWVIIGHSERRQYFGETDRTVNRRIRAALDAGLKPILCVGETLSQRDAGSAEAVVHGQLEGGLAGLAEHEVDDLVVAYEPVWAIGTGRTASPEQAQAMHKSIRGWLAQRFGAGLAEAIRIQYGGSVNPANAKLLLSRPDIDGALVGGAALDAKKFRAIAAAAAALS